MQCSALGFWCEAEGQDSQVLDAAMTEAIVETIQTYTSHCEVNQGPVRAFLIARLPGILANHYFPTLGTKRFNAFIEWSIQHPEWADRVRDGVGQSGEALRAAVCRAVQG